LVRVKTNEIEECKNEIVKKVNIDDIIPLDLKAEIFDEDKSEAVEEISNEIIENPSSNKYCDRYDQLHKCNFLNDRCLDVLRKYGIYRAEEYTFNYETLEHEPKKN
jgi:phosphoribosylformylglycinamidine (FGAM) synthase PurS component